MLNLKKLVFPPIFLIALCILIFQISSILKSFDIIFSFSFQSIIQLLILSLLLSFSAFLYALFTAVGNDWRINLVVGILAVLIPFLFLEMTLAVVLSVLLALSLSISYFNLQNSLLNYLNFAPNAVFGPSIRHLTTLLVISICIVYFFSINKIISEKGFQIPDSLLDSALKLNPLPEQSNQIEQLQTQTLLQNTIKQTVKEQFQNLIKPYLSFIPAILTILLFFTLQAFTALVNLLIYPFLWLTFYVLEKTNFIKFTTEMRQVKKMELS